MKIPFLDKFINKRVSEEVAKLRKDILPWSNVPEVNTFESLYNQMPPDMKAGDYLKAATSWVYACVSAISDEIATINIKLYRRTTKGVEEVDEEHELLKLLYKVNSFTTKFDHFSLTQEYLELVGEAPWALNIEGGKPNAMYLLRPDKLTMKFDKDKIIGGYEYEVGGGKKVSFEKEEIIFLRYPDPVKPFRGKGTLAAAAQTVNLDKYAEQYNVQFFFNSARPDAALETDQKLSEAQIAGLSKQWDKKFRGVENRAKIAVLEAGLKYKQMQLSQKDMDFIEQQRFSRDKIFSIFRVPKTVVAISDDVNRANAEAGAYAFARWTIRPKMERIIEQLNEFLVPMFGDDLFLSFDDPVPENLTAKLDVYENALDNGWMTINEVRDKEGLLPVTGGDEIYLPINLVSIGSTEPKKAIKKLSQKVRAKVKLKIKKEDIKDDLKDVIKSCLIREKPKKKEGEKSKEEKFWRAQIKIQEKLEKKFVDKLKILFENQRRETIRKLTKKAINIPSILLNVEEESKTFTIVLTPIVREVINQEGNLALSVVGVEETIDMATPAVISYLKKYPIKFSKSVNELTNKKIRKQLEVGIAGGEGTPQLAKRVNNVFGSAKKSRSLQIARTETSRAMGFATEEAYIQSGVVKAKEWLTAFDERTCERCAAMNGERIVLEENFFDKGDTFMGEEITYDNIAYPPLHVMCRCTLVPVLGTRGTRVKDIKIKIDEEEIKRLKEKAVEETKKEIKKAKEEELGEIRKKRDKISKLLEENESETEIKIKEGKGGTG